MARQHELFNTMKSSKYAILVGMPPNRMNYEYHVSNEVLAYFE